MVGLGAMDAFVTLFEITGKQEYLDFAKYCAQEIENRKGLELISRFNKGYDAALVGNGKIYEMLRLLTGLVNLYKNTGAKEYLIACEKAWSDISSNHLTPTGGPWGGICEKHRECFNQGYSFSPWGYVETCSSMAWFQFNTQMLKVTGDAKYGDELEKTAYNSLLGKMFPDGEGWIYHSRPNGKIMRTSEMACCSSSGPIALEEIPEVQYTRDDDRVFVNIFGASKIEFIHSGGDKIQIIQETNYPNSGKITLKIYPEKKTYLEIYIRIPSWVENPEVLVNEENYLSKPGNYCKIAKRWIDGDIIEINFPMQLRMEERTVVYDYGDFNDRVRYPNEFDNYFSVSYGPYALASSLENGFENLVYYGKNPLEEFNITRMEGQSPHFVFKDSEKAYSFVPYSLAGNMENRANRTTWVRWDKK